MGMREEIQAEMAEAFDDPDGLADAVGEVVGSRKAKGEYDPVTGTVIGGEPLSYTGRGVFGEYKTDEVDGSLILSTDTKLLVLQNELVAGDDLVEPKIGDAINAQRVLTVSQDPAGATWTIQLRA